MWDFFKPLRRKFGVAILSLAVMVVCLWAVSLDKVRRTSFRSDDLHFQHLSLFDGTVVWQTVVLAETEQRTPADLKSVEPYFGELSHSIAEKTLSDILSKDENLVRELHRMGLGHVNRTDISRSKAIRRSWTTACCGRSAFRRSTFSSSCSASSDFA